MRAAHYARVSTSDQVENTSLDDQVRRLREWAADHDWSVQGEYVDAGVSGASLARPQYLRMMEAVEAGELDATLAASADRLTRRQAGLPLLFEELEPYGVAVITLDGIDSRPDAGELSGGILSIVSGAERKRIRARTLRGRQAAAREGRFVGTTAPFGYRRQALDDAGWTLVVHPQEAEAIRYIVKRLVEEGAPFARVVPELNSRELPSPSGPGWDDDQLRRFMRRREVPARCAGHHSWQGIEQNFPAIISDGQAALWQEWQRERARPQTERGSYLLSGILRMPCGGGAMGRQVKHLREGRRNQPGVYACRWHFVPKTDPKYHPNCLSIYLDPVDAAVKNAIRARLQRALDQRSSPIPVDLDFGDLSGQREAALRHLEEATSSLILAGISGEAFVRSIAPLKEALAQADAAIAVRQREHARLHRSVDPTAVLRTARAALATDDQRMWRELLMALHVTVHVTGYETCPGCGGTGYQKAANRPRGWPPPCERCRRARRLPHLRVEMDDVVAARVVQGLR